MADKNKDEKLAAEIKAMEQAKRKAAPIKRDKEVSFDAWYHERRNSIPKHHMKEVIWADMKARGLGSKAKMEEFDRALELYGVKL